MGLFKFKLTILLFGIVVSTYGSNSLEPYAPYKCFKVYSIFVSSRAEADFLYNISLNNKAVDMWHLTKIPNRMTEAMISPEYQKEFDNKLKSIGMQFEVIHDDFSKINLSENIKKLLPTGQIDILNKFYKHSELNAYLDNLEAKYSYRVSVRTVGYSYENRSIKCITITNGKSNFKEKKVIFVEAGIHAREWVAPSTALYVIHQLVENFHQNKHLLEHYDWIVIPSTNPDGYEYTRTNDRYWRKTRKPSSPICYGIDGNRNFDYHWGEVGASPDPCNDTYKGAYPFSEPETLAIRDVLVSLHGRGKMYLSLHSFGRFLLYPWSYTLELPENWKDIDEVAQAGANAIRNVTGHIYIVGSSTNVLYAAAGSSDDYALGVTKIPIAITMELPPGSLGFELKPSEIKGIVTESWIGIKAMAEKVIEKY